MLTPAQQKVRRELEELQLKGLLHEKDDDVPAVTKQTKTVWIYIAIASLLLISPLLIQTYSKGAGQVSADYYLLKMYEYDQQSSLLLTEKPDLANLDELRALVQNAKELTAPTGFKNHKKDFIAVLEQKAAVIKSPSKRNWVTLDVKKELARDSLAKALKRENIKYKLLHDQAIQFWIDHKSYQY